MFARFVLLMERQKYTTRADNEFRFFQFESEGSKGSIVKGVIYQHLAGNIYNLVFGDWNDLTKKLDDKSRTNNNDRDKVLATVAYTVLSFLEHHPNAEIVFNGSSDARTRLYQIKICNNLQEATSSIYIKGFSNGEWALFEKGNKYESFSIKNNKKLP